MVIFLDDLQWIDSASLNLLKVLLTDPDLVHFLVIGAYRDNEVDATHPLMIGVAELEKEKVNLGRITLQDLTEADVNALCADTLHCDPQESRPLARLVYAKTDGNAFFTHQMLHALDEEKLLSLDAHTKRWQWDMAALQAMDITTNVVEFLVQKLHSLDTDILQVLKMAASIGGAIPISLLCRACDIAEEDLDRKLQALLDIRMMMRLHDACRFKHDRIQQAAYSLCTDDEKKLII
ncbi:MAG: hypothetical protein KZQ97_16760 [Candidatus Thiodiazotropha sp. (ex Dulcina madagascariensis)]|nr:hypothetical protein [Candidatus Thiodiazotropha sp. (ex Dulcina madagascariensis)]